MLSTLPASCTLRDLPPMPFEFAWFVFVEVHTALRFLQEGCCPPIAHGDLHSGNVLVGFTDVECEGPIKLKLKLIDFGEANTEEVGLTWDVRHLNVLVADIYQNRGTKLGCKELGVFVKMYDGGEDEGVDLKGLWKRFGETAKMHVKSEANSRQMKDLVRTAVESNAAKVRRSVEQALGAKHGLEE
jgi:serine/threonine protein kinase